MTPVSFPEANRTLLPPEGLENCDPLDVHVDGESCLSVWKMSSAELDEVIRNGGRVFVSVWSGGGSQPPIALQVHSPFPDRKSRLDSGASSAS